jgi:hydrogenase small subunit
MQPIKKITVLWITAGLGCDGESVALTAATQPSIEDIVMGGLPGVPEVKFLNPFYSFENGDEYLHHLELAAEDQLDPFLLVIEGSIPTKIIKGEGSWASLVLTRSAANQFPPAPGLIAWREAWAVIAVGTCATYGGIHAMEGNPTGAWDCRTILVGTGSKAGIPSCVRLPDAAG